MAAEKGSDFMAIAAAGHGAPAPSMRSGVIVKKEPAGGVGTAPDARPRSFDEELGGGAGKRGKEPVQATLARDELERPCSLVGDKLVVALGDSQDFVNWFRPGGGERFVVHDAAEHGAERLAKAKDAKENGIHGLGLVGEKGSKTCRTIFGDEASVVKEGNEFIPGQIASGGSEVGEIKSEAAG
jgi:hypothetical protein